eukprot:NODE_16519_length_990_cov_4.089224.p1 GENE.NODE_16519_length_990_cov_4.089224~~NODE_16519_length_990_cov_4.089224.p1  ORF type:complete len:197 (-),score=58.33 NODE_16519_length_990_cov_4.089224:329-919(-)
MSGRQRGSMRLSAVLARWLELLKHEHSGLSVFFTPSHGVAFNRHERLLMLALGVSSTWVMLTLKHWVHNVDQMVLGDMSGRSKRSALKRLIDGAMCFAAGTILQVLCGQGLAERVMRSSWNQEGGLKRIAALLADYWALLLSASGLLHARRHVLLHPEGVRSPAIVDWLEGCGVGFVVVEPGRLLLKAAHQQLTAA